MRRLVVVVAVVLAAAGCYAPSYNTPCTVRCGANNACPSGFNCLEDNYCHAPSAMALCPCVPLRCDQVPGACGDMADMCGGTVSCGDCELPEKCGGSGTPNVCGDPGHCTPQPCPGDACGPYIDSCGNPTTCPACPTGMKCGTNGKCMACTPHCQPGDLACGDDGCGGSCGSCPDARWTCHAPGLCCIKADEQCQPLTEGCNCCPGLFCESGFCVPAAGCAFATDYAGFVSDGSETLEAP